MARILIADDEPDILKVVNYRLTKAGYEVFMATNGKEALERIKEVKPDLILLDFSMPLMNGDEVCKQIKADPEMKHIPVVLMTASTEKVEYEYIKAIGFNDKIIKPFEADDLLGMVKKYIG
jgi:two-component system, OmpR family, alkaline phosphatase synthesis response regulator PhoP